MGGSPATAGGRGNGCCTTATGQRHRGTGQCGSGPATSVPDQNCLSIRPPAGAHQRLVFAHYFSPYPISIDNKARMSDYYARNYLQPSGEGGKFADVGGILRDRPMVRPPAAATGSSTTP